MCVKCVVKCCVCACGAAGVCLGLQVAVIEFARNVIGWEDAQSTEFNKDTTHPMVHTHTHTITTFMISHLPPLLYAGDRDA